MRVVLVLGLLSLSMSHFKGDEFNFGIRLGEWQVLSRHLHTSSCQSLTEPLPSTKERVSKPTGGTKTTAQSKSVCVCVCVCACVCACVHACVRECVCVHADPCTTAAL